MRAIRIALASLLCAGAANLGSARADDGTAGPQDDFFRRAQLMVHFQGKGSKLPVDAGVVSTAYQYIPALRDNRVVIGGNSSGSILAMYFANFGFSEKSLKYAEYRLERGNVSAIHGVENVAVLSRKLMRHEPTEIDHIALKEYVAFALGVEDWKSARSLDEIAQKSRARIKLPLIIVTANKDVLDNLVPGHTLEPQNFKVFDPRNFSVSWKPEIYEFYKQHPEQFRREHPLLDLGKTPYIGKACTFFVDPQMFRLLSRIPAEERLGDLRLISTPRDMLMAIVGSAAEPTYFRPYLETDNSKLMTGDRLGDLGNSRQRLYCGGYIMSLAAHDARRMLPSIRVLGTGWNHLPHSARQLLTAWYLVDMEPTADLNSWWADMECSPDYATRERLASGKVPPAEEFAIGQRTAQQYLEQDIGAPLYVAQPYYHQPAARAIYAVGDSSDKHSADLSSHRGLGPLIVPPAK